MPRTIAIGDIHGCAQALATLIKAIEPTGDDVIVTLGDYIDRGPDSKSVVDQLIALQDVCTLVPLLGNHEELLLEARHNEQKLMIWLANGGLTTLLSYGGGEPKDLPAEHLEFFNNCSDYYENDTHFMVHASYRSDIPLEKQPVEVLRWERIGQRFPEPHMSGRIAITGHTPQESGLPLNKGHLICIDTYCFGGGVLTALDADSGTIWQAGENGKVSTKSL